MSEPKPFEVHESGALLHGTKANFAVGDLVTPGRASNFESGRYLRGEEDGIMSPKPMKPKAGQESVWD